jgi:hypothetical protein
LCYSPEAREKFIEDLESSRLIGYSVRKQKLLEFDESKIKIEKQLRARRILR